jgi:hypothetical protein
MGFNSGFKGLINYSLSNLHYMSSNDCRVVNRTGKMWRDLVTVELKGLFRNLSKNDNRNLGHSSRCSGRNSI